MNESFHDIEPKSSDIAKGYKFALISSFIMMVIYLFVFFSIINILDGKFQKIVACLLALILFTLQRETIITDTKECGKDISATSGGLMIFLGMLPSIIASISLIYLIFF